MARTDLGDIEHLVLLAILRLGKDAYGIPILEEVSGRSGREVSRATVYVALKRLEQKGLLTSRLGDSTPERGGRAKRFFKLKPAGLKALRDSRAMFLGLWRDYETVLDRALMNELPRLARILARLIPAGDRESILGDLIEAAGFRGLAGARRSLWLTSECAAIAGGLSIQRARSWVVVPPVREVAAGLALDGRGVFRSTRAAGSLLRAILFCGSVATLALGVEVLVSSLLAASGY